MASLLSIPAPADFLADLDLVAAVEMVLEQSPEPLSAPRIRELLPPPLDRIDLDTLNETIRRQVSAHVFFRFPRYRGPHERYWHRPMRDHLEDLLCAAVADAPLAWNDIRRKLPDYAKMSAESVLEDLLIKKRIFRQPPTTSRMGTRYGIRPPDARAYMRTRIQELAKQMQDLGFSQPQIRAGLLDLVQESWPEHVPSREIWG